MFHLTLPPPPSVNRAFRNVAGKGRVKTRDYRTWRRDAVLTIYEQVPATRRIGGAVSITINLPAAMNGDIDNRIKGILDALVASRRIDDDKHVAAITVRRSAPEKLAMIWVEADAFSKARA